MEDHAIVSCDDSVDSSTESRNMIVDLGLVIISRKLTVKTTVVRWFPW